MDAYTKVILTVIAGALTVIAYNMTLKPTPAVALFSDGPTWGEYLAAMRGETSVAPADVAKRAPLVAVCDGPKCYRWSK